jgi:heat shock protein HtpX
VTASGTRAARNGPNLAGGPPAPTGATARGAALDATAATTQRRLSVVAGGEVAALALVLFVLVVALSPLPWFVDAVLALAVAAGVVGWWWASIPQRVLGDIGAEPTDERRHARYRNLVEGLCLSFGVEPPELHVVADDAPNAASLAGRGGAHLVCTSGLLDQLDRVGLEGVIAHELAHVRGGDAAAATTAVALIGYPTLGGDGPVGRALRPVGDALAPVRDRLFVWCLGPEREVAADLTAVGVTRYPPGLHQALRTIARTAAPLGSASAATAPLWFHEVGPSAPEGPVAAGALHPPLDQRIEVLGEL